MSIAPTACSTGTGTWHSHLATHTTSSSRCSALVFSASSSKCSLHARPSAHCKPVEMLAACSSKGFHIHSALTCSHTTHSPNSSTNASSTRSLLAARRSLDACTLAHSMTASLDYSLDDSLLTRKIRCLLDDSLTRRVAYSMTRSLDDSA